MSVQSIYNNVATANVNTTGKATENKKEEANIPKFSIINSSEVL